MKRFVLILPEGFAQHAAALINKVHARPRPERRDRHSGAMTAMRTLDPAAHIADYTAIFKETPRADAPL